MYDNMRRLHPRGVANRGICVDAEGAMLGPDCVLVRSTPGGFQSLAREDAARLQKCLPGARRDRGWLFQQCRRIADALNRGEVTLAQIYGLRIPIGDIDDAQLKRVGSISNLCKAGFNPDEPRIPKGDPHGGEWAAGDSTATSGSPASDGDPRDNGETAESGTVAPEFDPREGGRASEASGGNKSEAAVLGEILPVADFSGGFHDAVVDAWADYFQKSEIPAVKTPAIRVIGPNNSIIGYPDIVVALPGVGLAVIEVKTGEFPTYTPNQTAYFPLIQVGDHIYTTDTRISRLGLATGVPFPPMPVYILHAPGPGRPYDAWKLPPPQLGP